MELREPESVEAKTNLPAYEPTQEERRALAVHRKRLKRRIPVPDMKVIDRQECETLKVRGFGWKHKNTDTAFDLFHASINSVGNTEFMRGLLLNMAEATTSKSASAETAEDLANFCLPILQGVKPRDEIEALLAAQMAVTHCAFMRMATKHASATDLMREQTYEKQVNRFARTFTAQMQALKIYRAKGKQSIVVKHVTVTHGGQAIIGNVKNRGRRGRGAAKISEATP